MNLLKKLRYVPKSFAIVSALVVALTATAATFAWGPTDREIKTWPNAFTYVTFNSIDGNPNYGYEREFTTIKDVTAGSGYNGSMKLTPGHEYEVQMYVHNNAGSEYNASGVGIAKDVKIRAALPASVTGNATINGFLTSSNANPSEIWDSANLTSDGTVHLEFINNSARIKTHFLDTSLSDSIITSGVAIGDQALDGKWRGCLEFAGYIKFRFKVKDTTFTMSKEVRKHTTDSGGWTESYTANPGETVDFLIRYKNTGDLTQENVTVKDVLPTGLTYVPGSTVLANANNQTPKQVSDNVTGVGINIGSYTPGSDAWVRFSAKVVNKDVLACGVNTLKNVATVTTAAGPKSDDAVVIVTTECIPVEKTIEVCRLSDNKYPVTIKESEFDSSKYSKNPADCKPIEVCRLDDKKIVTIKESEYDSNKYSKNLADCDAPKGAPTEIPSTGPAEFIGNIVGSSALGYGAYSYLNSRRALKKAHN
ncbi:DUF11 domain-containing protein [Candidatus Saccharibacteria bacterium]|nr:DUF11 domain-containing protein [Candidatus Saccharibacteria bacterium]NCU40604.1 DUF11 domain-containing protein [Candidatus Saccharibacteria bacterium]